jgi:hypothetical protein
MTRGSNIQSLLTKKRRRLRAAARDRGALFARLEKLLPEGVQPLLRFIYERSDGGPWSGEAQIPRLKDVVSYVEAFSTLNADQAFGFIPLLEANDSNPMCLITRGPLNGFVAHLRHDDCRYLCARSAEELLRAFDWRTYDDGSQACRLRVPAFLEADFVGAAKPFVDAALAGRLFDDMPRGGDPVEHAVFGIQLASTFGAPVARLLDHTSVYVREIAAEALGELGSARAISSLERLATRSAGDQDGRAAREALAAIRARKRGESSPMRWDEPGDGIRPKRLFINFAAAVACTHCGHGVRRFRIVGDALVCTACGLSFRPGAPVLERGQIHEGH